MSKRERIGRGILAVILVFTAGFQIIGSWSYGHITNPNWHPHTKYHLITYQLMLLMVYVPVVRGCLGKGLLSAIAGSVALYSILAVWISCFLAGLFPGTSLFATAELAEHRVPTQFFVGALMMAGAVVGWAAGRAAGTSQSEK